MGNTFAPDQKTASRPCMQTVHIVGIRFTDCFSCPRRGLVDKESRKEV